MITVIDLARNIRERHNKPLKTPLKCVHRTDLVVVKLVRPVGIARRRLHNSDLWFFSSQGNGRGTSRPGLSRWHYWQVGRGTLDLRPSRSSGVLHRRPLHFTNREWFCMTLTNKFLRCPRFCSMFRRNLMWGALLLAMILSSTLLCVQSLISGELRLVVVLASDSFKLYARWPHHFEDACGKPLLKFLQDSCRSESPFQVRFFSSNIGMDVMQFSR